MNIVVLDGYTLNPGDLSWDGLKKMGALTIYDRTSHEDILKRCEGAEIIFTNKTLLSRETLSSLKSLKYIGVLTTGYNVVDVQTLYENSDIISLHCPLFDDTKGMINKETIAQMKDGVIIINTSRGPLIVEEDLAEALNSGKVYAAAVDVLST